MATKEEAKQQLLDAIYQVGGVQGSAQLIQAAGDAALSLAKAYAILQSDDPGRFVTS